jgi:hypothetical protein
MPGRRHDAAAVCVAVVCVAALVILAAPGETHPLTPTPADDPAYADLYRLAADGLVPLWAVSVRPLTRIEVARLVAEALDRVAVRSPAAYQASLTTLERLVLQFAEELGLLGYRIVEPPLGPSAATLSGWGVEMERALIWRAASGSVPWFQSNPGSAAGLEIGAVAGFGPGLAFGIHLQPALGAASTATSIDRLYLSAQGTWGNAQAGLDRLWWGPGARGAWLLSNWPGTLQTIRWSAEWGRLRAVKLMAPIKQHSGRHLYGMRLDWLATETLRIGMGESVMASGGLAPVYLLNPIPLLAYGISNSRRQAGLQDNYNIAVDFDWRIGRGTIVYGEFFIDGFTTTADAFPARGGATAGLFFADPFRTERTTLRLEHARSTNWTYTTPDSVNDYASNGRVLGHWCAPDCELWSAELSHQTSSNAVVRINWDFARRGEGRVGQSWPTASDAWSNLYLSGVVENTQSWRLSYVWASHAGSRHEVGVGVSSVANAAHVPGATRQDWLFWWEARHAF